VLHIFLYLISFAADVHCVFRIRQKFGQFQELLCCLNPQINLFFGIGKDLFFVGCKDPFLSEQVQFFEAKGLKKRFDLPLVMKAGGGEGRTFVSGAGDDGIDQPRGLRL